MEFRDLNNSEVSSLDNVEFKTLDAPNETVFDADNERVVSMPQTLNNVEAEFLIARDVDNHKDFFGMEKIGEVGNIGRGVGAFVLSQPQAFGGLALEQAELTKSRAGKTRRERDFDIMGLGNFGLAMQITRNIRDLGVNTFGSDDVIEASNKLIERNKKYIADSGFERPEEGGLSGFMYDLGNGGGSLLASIGLSVLTRSPVTASAYFGSIQKSSVYQESRESGKTPEQARDISTIAGTVEGGLEMIGLDRFMKAMKGNTGVKRFIQGFAIEAIQEGSQAIGEELITQVSGVRDKDAVDTIQDILYQAVLGGIIGGHVNLALGKRAKEEAVDSGLSEEIGSKLGEYVAENLDVAKKDVTEFIEKELAPIAKDDATAQEFMQIMKDFGNDVNLVNEESLDPEQKAVFDKFVNMFDSSVSDIEGVKEVEKTFSKQLQDAGIEQNEADIVSSLVGARADANTRALNVTPQEALELLNTEIQGVDSKVEVKATPDAIVTEVKRLKQYIEAKKKKDLTAEKRSKTFDAKREEKNKQRIINGQKPLKKSVKGEVRNLPVLKRLPDIHPDGAFAQELSELGITPRTEPWLFARRTKSGKEANKTMDDLPLSEFDELQELGLSGDRDTDNVDVGELLELIDEEYNRGRSPVEQEQTEEDINEKILEDFFREDIDIENMTEKEAVEAIKALEGKILLENEQVELEQKERDFTDYVTDNVFFQDKKSPRGSVTFTDNKTIMNLFEGRNKSTILHELGHIFLRDMQKVSKLTSSPRVKSDYKAVEKWLGTIDGRLTRNQEEKFARGFEAYLREGKAPKPELQGAFDRFKEWLTAIYTNVKQLNVKLTPEIREVFDRMLGGDFVQSETLNQENEIARVEEDYNTVRNMPVEGTLKNDTSSVFRNTVDLGSDIFTPVSSRLGRIDQKLKHAVRKFVFKTGFYAHEDSKVVEPFIKSVSDNFSLGDYRELDLALKNRDTDRVEFLIDSYGLQEEWKSVRDILDKIYNEALDVGLDIQYIEDYFPRKVERNRAAEYIATMRGDERWSDIELAMKDKDPAGVFDQEEQAAFINSYLRGFSSQRINLSKPSFSKERTVDYVTPEFNIFYKDSMPTLIEYISALRHGIEARKMFGKSEVDTDTNIGAYVLDLINDGIIDQKQEQEMKAILKAVVEPAGTHGVVAWMKNFTYITTMGSPISAITQIGDLAFALHKNGYYRTGKSLLKSLSGKQVLKKEDIGIDNILQEFEDETRASKAVRAVFRAVGLEFMDNIGKETFIDSSYSRLRKEAKKNNKEFKKEMSVIFGDQSTQTIKDLLDGTMSENVKYLLFSELSDVQPISLAEMPVSYLTGGNWRVMYMLKTYTMKQLDIYRREIFDNIGSGDMKKVAKGMKNLVSLSSALMIMGMSSDAIKDLLLGREMTADDLVIDNILKLFGVSKYHMYKARQEGIGNTIFRFLTPPILSPIDDLRDTPKIFRGEKDAKDADILSKIPLVGKFYYWWYGGGQTKTKKRKQKKSSVSTP